MEKQKITIKHFLKNRILWKVYVMWFLRRIVPIIVLQVAVFAFVFQLFAKNVFISMVFKNAATVSANGYWALLKYMAYAFLNTHPLTQVLILVILGVLSLLIRDAVRMVATYRAMWIRGNPDNG